VTVAERIAEVRGRVGKAARRAGRDPGRVTIVAVAKGFGADLIAEALHAGISDVGENRAQELSRKVSVLGDVPRWHFVGALQTNKVRNVVGVVELVHSVDRLELANAIGRRAAALGKTQDVLIEVNLAGEPTKHGCLPDELEALAAGVASADGVELRGLMTMPPQPVEPEDSRPYFKELAALRDALVQRHPAATELSMGMTGDFEVAVEEGASLLRVGEAIFGPRDN
jgi:PLP dependent protein